MHLHMYIHKFEACLHAGLCVHVKQPSGHAQSKARVYGCPQSKTPRVSATDSFITSQQGERRLTWKVGPRTNTIRPPTTNHTEIGFGQRMWAKTYQRFEIVRPNAQNGEIVIWTPKSQRELCVGSVFCTMEHILFLKLHTNNAFIKHIPREK